MNVDPGTVVQYSLNHCDSMLVLFLFAARHEDEYICCNKYIPL